MRFLSVFRVLALALLFPLGLPAATAPWVLDETPPPTSQPAPAPVDGAIVSVNPPALIWKADPQATRYEVEFSLRDDFSGEVIRVQDVPYAFYNHDRTLGAGDWFWRYTAVGADGSRSTPSRAKHFVVAAGTPVLPLPRIDALMAALPAHPRLFTTPATLAEFRARRDGSGRVAWEQARLRAEEVIKLVPTKPELSPLPAKLPTYRRQVFWVEPDGTALVPRDYTMLELNRDAGRANLLSFAYLISGEEKYAEAAKAWALFVAHFRMDYHLKTVAERGQHDTVVYAYETGVKNLALAYDRLYDRLSPDERRALLDHFEFQGEAAMHWIRDVMHLDRDFQDSHGQQCMHMTLTLALAIAGDSPKAKDWLAYMIPQYANRIPWMSEDGGYFEGQSYAFKLSYILEALAALRTATGLDLFQKPEIKNSAEFFLYCQSMNYWWPQWGDTMGLYFPFGNIGDAFMASLLAAMTNNRPLQWWSERVPADPATPPLGYLAATGVVPQPPVGVPQAKAFIPTGVVAAFDNHADEGTTRVFFRSSPWGGESHAHADQNSFIIHHDGEILAADTGYYTYYGDENYNKVSTQTISHNSVLVDGRGQLNDRKGEGRITSFFHSPRFTFTAGDASHAYDGALSLFRRDLLYLRPGLVIVTDELRAPQPATFTWLLNTFVAPEIDSTRREFNVVERGATLWGKQIFPETMMYEADNKKLTPRKTKFWTRYTEAYPEPWRMHATTAKAERSDILTVLQPYTPATTARAEILDSQRDDHGSLVQVKTEDGQATVLVRRRIDETARYSLKGYETDGRIAAWETNRDKTVTAWMAVEARGLWQEGRALFEADQPIGLALEHPGAAAAQLSITTTKSTRVSVAWPAQPEQVQIAPAASRDRVAVLSATWREGKLSFDVPVGDHTIWIDPKLPAGARPPTLSASFVAGEKNESVPFETTTTENGDWAAYATLTPPAPGVYDIAVSDTAASILVRDAWDPERTVRGQGKVRALVGDRTEIVLRFAPTGTLPQVTARLAEAIPLSRINLLRNGDCEAGLPGFPPRGWSAQTGVSSETYGVPGEQGWPGWSTEDAAHGKASLKFIRPLNVSVDWRPPYPVLAKDQMLALAPPVRLRTAGRYVLSCQTKGTATTARVELETAAGVVHRIPIEPSAQWTPRRVELDLPAGYTQVRVRFVEGGAPDQVLWADDFFLAPVGK